MTVKVVNRRRSALRVECLSSYEITSLDTSIGGLGPPDVLGPNECLTLKTERDVLFEIADENIVVKIV